MPVGIDEILGSKRDDVVAIARRHGARSVRVFGSVARGDAGPDSDVDLLVEVTGPTPPWFPGGLVADLEELLDRRVSVVEEQSLNKQLQESILKDAVPL